jgi:hypothetical protein
MYVDNSKTEPRGLREGRGFFGGGAHARWRSRPRNQQASGLCSSISQHYARPM